MTLTMPRPLAHLAPLLARSSALHSHLCPRQVLGVRIGLLAEQVLGLEFPRTDKRVLVFVETDGCFADGVSVASGCWLGRRTMRLMDFGKVAATFIDTKTGRAVRIAPQTDVRQRVRDSRPTGLKRWDAYMDAYQRLPDEELLTVQDVELTLDLRAIISVAGKRAVCDACHEEIINEREVVQGGRVLCQACAGAGYFRAAQP